MNAYLSSFKFGYRQITRDNMLIMLLFAPFLSGAIFKFFIPAVDIYIANSFGIDRVILPYYQLLDILLAYLTPSLIGIIFCFLILEERDDEVASYIFVTPIGYSGYILTRLIIPSIFAFCLSFLVLMLFKLTQITVALGITMAFLSTMYAVVTTLIVVSVAKNKVEGLALIKFTGTFFLGVLAPYFIKDNIQYAFAVLPSFWLAKATLAYGSSSFFSAVLLGALCSAVWIGVFYRVFKSKVA